MKKEQGPFYLLVKGTPVKVDRRVYEETLWFDRRELYYLGKTEREAGKRLKISKSTIRRRKEAILFKLKNFVERFF